MSDAAAERYFGDANGSSLIIMMRGKHIIVTLGRSGSNTLVDMLNQHPAILNFGEVLGEWTMIRRFQRRLGLFRRSDAAYLDAVLGRVALQRVANEFRTLGKAWSGKWYEIKRMRDVETVGFKDFSLNFKRYGLDDYITRTSDAKVIGLTRANVLDRMISTAFLQATGVVASTSRNANSAPRQIRLDPKRVLDQLNVIDRENQDLAAVLDALPPGRVMRLDYEDLYTSEAHTIETVRQVYAFLGVSDMVPQVRMQKIVRNNPLAALVNAEEIHTVISTSKFKIYLPDTPIVNAI